MSLICPNCETEVEFDDDGMPEKRRPVRCGSCGESWFRTKPSPNEPTTSVLSAQGPRRAALGSGPWGAWPCGLVVMRLGQ